MSDNLQSDLAKHCMELEAKLASQQAAHEAEIARLREEIARQASGWGRANTACAMKDEALKVANAMLVEQESALRQMGCDEPNAEPAIIQVRDALSASTQLQRKRGEDYV